MFELCWFISEMVVRFFYLLVVGFIFVVLYTAVNDDLDDDCLMVKLRKLLIDFDDDEVYETE